MTNPARQQINTLPFAYQDLFDSLGIDLAQYAGTRTTFLDLLEQGTVSAAQLEAAGFGDVPSIDGPYVARNYQEYVKRIHDSAAYGGTGAPLALADWWRTEGAGSLLSQVATRAGGYTHNVHGTKMQDLQFVDEHGDIVEDAYIPPEYTSGNQIPQPPPPAGADTPTPDLVQPADAGPLVVAPEPAAAPVAATETALAELSGVALDARATSGSTWLVLAAAAGVAVALWAARRR